MLPSRFGLLSQRFSKFALSGPLTFGSCFPKDPEKEQECLLFGSSSRASLSLGNPKCPLQTARGCTDTGRCCSESTYYHNLAALRKKNRCPRVSAGEADPRAVRSVGRWSPRSTDNKKGFFSDGTQNSNSFFGTRPSSHLLSLFYSHNS